MVLRRTFLISNLTLGPNLIFIDLSFLSRVIFRVFLSYFVYPLKNKTKISGDSII